MGKARALDDFGYTARVVFNFRKQGAPSREIASIRLEVKHFDR